MGDWQDLITGIRQLPPSQRRDLERLAWRELWQLIRSWPSALTDWVRILLIKRLAGKRSVLLNVQITGSGNTIRMSSPALIDGVSLDRSTPAEDSIIAIIGDDHGITIAPDQGD